MSGFKMQYDHLWTSLEGAKNAHQKAVGGDFDTVGHLEFQLLKAAGLRQDSTVIDVGCGSGRLASQLAPWLHGKYIGTDIIGSLLDHARALCGRDDWQFVETNGLGIPAGDGSADFVVFFSVFTHLTHEESWHYIKEAHRVLRVGGKLVCSFLEFAIYSHWTIFENSAGDRSPQKILNQFLSRDALNSFAHHAGFSVETILDGDRANIVIEKELVWENGSRMSGVGSLGQSTCVMVKKGG
jgi:ubiquinone/menaquinone biosynthesis C-methylase UbiE